MCTAFVRKGKDIITGFNFDMNVGGIEYVPVIEQNRVGLGIPAMKTPCTIAWKAISRM